MRAADIIVQSLAQHGVKRVYCVPGESYLALLDALHGSTVQVVVSRGPGATNGSIALHVAEQDAAPVIMFTGQVSRLERGRGAFQEVDYGQVFGTIAKGVFEVHDATKMAETCTRAFHLAAEGVAGPVVISLPEDVLEDDGGDSVPAPYPIAVPHHVPADIAALQALIDKAERPLVVAGSRLRGKRGAEALAHFAEAQRLPVATAWKAQDVFDNTSPLFAGHIGFGVPPKFKAVLAEADLIIAVGTRLGDVASLNYTFPNAPLPAQRLVHIYPDSRPVGRLFRTDLAIIADPAPVLEALAGKPRVVSSVREGWITSLCGFVRDFMTFKSPEPRDGVDFGKVVMALAAQAPRDAIIVTDAGNISTWVHRHWKMTPANMLIGAVAGAMGIGVPAAVAASLTAPSRMPIVVVGDGGVLMTGNELATALQYGAKPKIVISDNGSYGTIRAHQEREFPQRVSGTELHNPDFTAWAKSFGALAVTIASDDDIAPKVAEALLHDGAAVIHVKSSKQALSAFVTLAAASSAQPEGLPNSAA